MDSERGRNKLLLFGANGAIGSALHEGFRQDGWDVVATSRHAVSGVDWLKVDPFASDFNPALLDTGGKYTAVCWAQGANINDSIYDVDPQKHLELYQANCLFIAVTLQLLLARKLLAPASRLCVISSIWQNLARQNKFSYSVTKSALQGLVLSASADLAADGHLINAILPGVLDTPMTRRNLTTQQIDAASSATKFNRLPQLKDVVSLASYLCSPKNTGITGQFLAADLGFSHVRII